jgi:Zn-dependent metalloprotease
MNFRKTMLAASIAVLPLMLANAAVAAGPMMAAPAAQATPQQNAVLVAKLASAHAAKGLDENHGFAVTAQHPGVSGQKITRAAHTVKGVRVWQSESVVVTDASGNIVSDSSSDRRAGQRRFGLRQHQQHLG